MSKIIDKVRLERLETSSEGTFGRLTYNDFVAFTGELADRGNQSNVSCIPKGTYWCSWTQSDAFKRKLYAVENVPNRAGIRIHAANFMGDSEKGLKKQLNGCIALGLKLGRMDGQKALLLSKPAVRQFETLMNKRSFLLEII